MSWQSTFCQSYNWTCNTFGENLESANSVLIGHLTVLCSPGAPSAWGEVTSAVQDNPFHGPAGSAGPGALQVTGGSLGCWRCCHLKFNLLSLDPHEGLCFSLLFSVLYTEPGLLSLRCRVQKLILLIFNVIGDCPALFIRISLQVLSRQEGVNISP